MSVAWVGAGISAVGALSGAAAAGDAADAQTDAANAANATAANASAASIAQQKAAAAQQRADLSPWMGTGNLANNELSRRLGLGGAGGSNYIRQAAQAIKAAFPTWTSGSGSDAEIVSSFVQRAPQIAASKQEQDAGSYGSPEIAQLSALMPQARQAFEYIQNPQAGGGSGAGEGSLLKKFDQSDLDSDLVYQSGLKFGLDTGTNQLNTRAASAGGYGSGEALKALTRFGNDYATTKVGGAYDRNMGEKNQTYSFLSGQSQQGQNAAAGVGAAGMNSASQIGSTGMNAAGQIGQNQLASGNAQSAGIVGGANAISGGISDITNAYQWNQLLNKNKATTPAYGSSEPYPGYNASIGFK